MHRWSELPNDVQARIVHMLPLHSAAQVACVSRKMLAHVQSDTRWADYTLPAGSAPAFASGNAYQHAQAALRHVDCGPHARKLLRENIDCPTFNQSVRQLGLEQAYLWRALCNWQMAASQRHPRSALSIEGVATQIFTAYQAGEQALDFTYFRIASLPECLGVLTGLQKLSLAVCTKLEALPSSLGRLTALRELDLAVCQTLTTLPPSLGQLRNLQKLNLVGCSNITSLPTELHWLDEAGGIWTRSSGLSKSARNTKAAVQLADTTPLVETPGAEPPGATQAAATTSWRERLSKTWRRARASSKGHP